MVEVALRDSLQPALLDRLTDQHPERKTEGRDERVISRAQLRASVLRDLSWLFNTTNLSAELDLTRHPLVARSTVNYGLTPLSGRPVSNLDLTALERLLKEAILAFEPRILAPSLTVTALPVGDALTHHNILSFEIAGELWGQPYPLELLIRTEMDLESGEVRLAEGR